MSNRRNDRRPLRRRAPFRTPLPFLLVVAEGRNTEPQYVEGFRRYHANRLVRVKVLDGVGVPLTVVEEAVAERKASRERARLERDVNLEYDEVWCLFDVDEHPKLEEARAVAVRERLNIAVSNPCFELWLLLHFRDHTAHIERQSAARLLREHLAGYDKNVSFDDLVDGYQAAVTRAILLDRRAAEMGAPTVNPTTGVYKLTERIRELSKR